MIWILSFLFQVQANMEAQGLRDDLKEKTEKISERQSRQLAEDLQAEMVSALNSHNSQL